MKQGLALGFASISFIRIFAASPQLLLLHLGNDRQKPACSCAKTHEILFSPLEPLRSGLPQRLGGTKHKKDLGPTRKHLGSSRMAQREAQISRHLEVAL